MSEHSDLAHPLIVPLLNLTGLGLGYLRVRRRQRWLFHLALTAGLLAAAFGTNTCRAPLLWGVALGLWWLWMAFDGWRLARRRLKGAPDKPRWAWRAQGCLLMFTEHSLLAGCTLYIIRQVAIQLALLLFKNRIFVPS